MLTPLAVLSAAFTAGAVALWIGRGARLGRVSAPPPGVGDRLAQRRTGSGRGAPASGSAPIARVLVLGGSSVAFALATSWIPGGPGAWSWLAAPILLGLGLAGARLETGAARRRRQQLIEELPQALELMAACLAAGMPVRRRVRRS